MCEKGGNTGTVCAPHFSRASPTHMAFALSLLTVWFVCVYMIECVSVCMCPFVLRCMLNVQASLIVVMCLCDCVCVCACVCAQACQLRCASSVERSSRSDHEGYFLTLISPEIFFFSPRSLFPLSLSSMFLFLQVPLSQNRGNSTASGCTEVTLFQSRPKFSKSHPGARL